MSRYLALLLLVAPLHAEVLMPWSEFSFMLRPSPIGGVGVFATHDISAGTHLFNSGLDLEFDLRVMQVKDVPPLLLRYCIYISNDEVVCPDRFDRMEIGWYINHSSTPNIANKGRSYSEDPIENLKNRRRDIYAIRDIRAGEEILIDYNGLDEPEHLKEDYYR